MLHLYIVRLVHWGWPAALLPLQALYHEQYLDSKQAMLLALDAAMFISLMLPGWLLQALRLVLNGFFVLLVLDMFIAEYEQFISRYEIRETPAKKPKKYALLRGKPIFMVQSYRTLKKFKIKQTFILPIVVLLWIAIKARYTQAPAFGVGLPLADGSVFEGFLVSLDGWNCNYPEFTVLSLIWLGVLVFCYWFMGNVIRAAQLDDIIDPQTFNDINSYKIYSTNYLVLPSIAIFSVDFLYNLVAHVDCDGLLECYPYFKRGIVLHWFLLWGLPCWVLYFFHKKSGKFCLKSEQGNTIRSLSDNQDPLLEK